MTHRPERKRSADALVLTLLALAGAVIAEPVTASEIEVTAADPSEAQEAPEGTVNLDVTVTGNGFGQGAVVTFLLTGTETPGGIDVRNVDHRGPKKMIVNIDINENTVPDDFDVQLFDIKVQLNGGVGKGTELFGVLKATGPPTAFFDGSVGHVLGCLPCTPDPSCVEGDFHDLGTTGASGSTCELLTCTDGGNSLSCGRRDQPKPRIDITGLFHIWDDDAGSQGDPAVCFPGGIIDATVRTGDGGTVAVALDFYSLVDGTLPGRCSGATDEIKYRADVESCVVTDGTHPPAIGETVTVSCFAGSEISIKTEGGGGTAKKCGCVATGPLGATTEITFLGVSD